MKMKTYNLRKVRCRNLSKKEMPKFKKFDMRVAAYRKNDANEIYKKKYISIFQAQQ